MRERWWQKWWIWLLVTILLLLIVHSLFKIHPRVEWFEAVWSPGELLSFIGTIVLGYIAIYQSKKANDIAEQSIDMSKQLIQSQQAEYTPLITITKFAGLTNQGKEFISADGFLKSPHSDLVVHEMRTNENTVLLGYSMALILPEVTTGDKLYERVYELHLQFTGKIAIKDIKFLSVELIGVEFYKRFDMNSKPELSLSNGDELTLFLFLIGNTCFTERNTEGFKYIRAPKIRVAFDMTTINEDRYLETAIIYKHLVTEPEAILNQHDTEHCISISYDVKREN